MNRFHLFLIPVILFLTLGSTMGYGQTKDPERPDVIYFDQLQDWMTAENDSLYVINFWATWCRPCVAELPYFEKLNAQLEGKKARIILISLDFVEDYDRRFKPFLKKKKLKSSVVLLDEPNANAWIDRVSEEWSGAIPATLVSPPNREEAKFYEQEFHSVKELEAIINSLIPE